MVLLHSLFLADVEHISSTPQATIIGGIIKLEFHNN